MNRRHLWCAPFAAVLAVAGALSAAEEPQRPEREVITKSGLRYIDLKLGEGDEARPGQVVEVQYTGWLQDGNGTPFETSRDCDEPLTFRVGAGDVLKGWDEGIQGMKVGGKRKLVIPPELGYGKQGAGSVVPPNATLVFEFELLAVRGMTPAPQGKGR
jgi:FKBP-type peptidyl-prolyl cis-trans isomerase